MNVNNRIVCYDIKELGKQMKKLGMLIVQDQVWGRVTANRSSGKSTRYYMDEINESAKLFERITDPALTVRRITINANKVTPDEGFYQVDFFTDTKKLEKEKKLQQAMLGIKNKYGKNAVQKASSYEEGATMRQRNAQIGGHSTEVRREVRMENYKNSKIGRETAQKYGDILEMERPQTEESLRKHPRMTLAEPG